MRATRPSRDANRTVSPAVSGSANGGPSRLRGAALAAPRAQRVRIERDERIVRQCHRRFVGPERASQHERAGRGVDGVDAAVRARGVSGPKDVQPAVGPEREGVVDDGVPGASGTRPCGTSTWDPPRRREPIALRAPP